MSCSRGPSQACAFPMFVDQLTVGMMVASENLLVEQPNIPLPVRGEERDRLADGFGISR